MSLKVNWTNPCHIDGVHGSYGFSEKDSVNGIGLKRWVLRFPRGEDGKSNSVETITYTMDGVDGGLNHHELVAKVKELGLWDESKSEVAP